MYLSEENGGREYIRFDEHAGTGRKSTLYAPGTGAFLRLVRRVIATGIYEVEDLNQDPAEEGENIARQWMLSFGGSPKAIEVEEVLRCFEGKAIMRVRATVAHDSYEHLIEVPCSPAEHHARAGRSGLGPLPPTIENPIVFGLNVESVTNAAGQDAAISEFCRFYLERRAQEVQAATGDNRKQKKLEDEFTPRVEMTLVAVEGRLHRQMNVQVQYRLDSDCEYQSLLTVRPHTGELLNASEMGLCARSGKTVPKTCLKQCQITGATVLEHLLIPSETSSRLALPEFTVVCALSGKRVLKDEVEVSEASGRLVASSLLRTSPVSGKRAEPDYFGQCEFTKALVLNTELAISEVSGKRYRLDERMRSTVSGKVGHKQEFVICHESQECLARAEAVQCEVTGHYVRPGILQPCAVTKKMVLPSELLRCAVTGNRALKRFLVRSSLSDADILEDVAFRSATGKFCTPVEARPCLWSGRKFHPDDLRVCTLTGLPVHFEFATSDSNPCLHPLLELLKGIKRTADRTELWDAVAAKIAAAVGRGRCRVEAGVLSPDGRLLAVCVEVRTLLGLRIHQAGCVYGTGDHVIVGRVSQGRRASAEWSAKRS